MLIKMVIPAHIYQSLMNEVLCVGAYERNGICEWDSNISFWFEPTVGEFGQCLAYKLLHLYACGIICTQTAELTIGRCIDNKCKCCTMLDSNGWFTSRGYTQPCLEESPVHNGGCQISCKQQGAVKGKCELNNCMCFMNIDA